MLKAIINTPNITPANTKATLDASDLVTGFAYTTNIWAKGDLVRVYINNRSRKEVGYVEFRGGIVTVVRSDSHTSGHLTQLTEIFAGELVEPVKTIKTISQARNWDNLQNEGYSDGYNPYRTMRVA